MNPPAGGGEALGVTLGGTLGTFSPQTLLGTLSPNPCLGE